MTKSAITKKLKAAGISLDGLTISADGEIEVSCMTKRGKFSERLTEKKLREVTEAIEIGGYRCDHGAWILSADFKSSGDWNDKSSACHY